MKQILLPKKIISASGVENARALLKKQPLTPVLRWDKDWESSIAYAKAGASITLDFGKEMHGGIRILLSRAKNGSKARVRFGESLGEANAEMGEKNATNDHSPRDITVTLSAFSDLSFGQTGFRFVRIDFLEGEEFCLQNVLAENLTYRGTLLYRYTGQDREISRIFTAAKRTVDLCASTAFVWDGVKRDRLVWMGDLHLEILALTTLYGRLPQIENSLTHMVSVTPLPGWMNNYPAYSFWWMIALSDYALQVEAGEYAKKNTDYLSGLLAQIDGCVKKTGELCYAPQKLDKLLGCIFL